MILNIRDTYFFIILFIDFNEQRYAFKNSERFRWMAFRNQMYRVTVENPVISFEIIRESARNIYRQRFSSAAVGHSLCSNSKWSTDEDRGKQDALEKKNINRVNYCCVLTPNWRLISGLLRFAVESETFRLNKLCNVCQALNQLDLKRKEKWNHSCV